jgi:hypothetical protein
MRRAALLTLLVAAILLPPYANADGTDNSWGQGVQQAGVWISLRERINEPGSPLNAPIVRPAGNTVDPYEYRTTLGCGNKTDPDANDNPTGCTFGLTVCSTPTNPGGVLYYSWIRRAGTGAPWRFNGESCSLAALPAAPTPPPPSLAQIRQAFKELPFGRPAVAVQPVGGKTLVNLATFFETRWDGAGLQPGDISAPVQLLSWRVEFEVATQSYTYDFGDGSRSEPTIDTGGPYPNGTIRHTYLVPHAAAQVKVDTILTGRFRVNGGAWQDLGGTADLADEPVTTLAVLEATSRLHAG